MISSLSLQASKGTYKVTNWPEYNKALKRRGSLTVWIEEGVLDISAQEGKKNVVVSLNIVML